MDTFDFFFKCFLNKRNAQFYKSSFTKLSCSKKLLCQKNGITREREILANYIHCHRYRIFINKFEMFQTIISFIKLIPHVFKLEYRQYILLCLLEYILSKRVLKNIFICMQHLFDLQDECRKKVEWRHSSKVLWSYKKRIRRYRWEMMFYSIIIHMKHLLDLSSGVRVMKRFRRYIWKELSVSYIHTFIHTHFLTYILTNQVIESA